MKALSDYTIGVIGGGVVGRATARAFIEHVKEVRVYDKNPERQTHDLPTTMASQIVFVCLPTPQKEGSLACDTSIIEDFFALLRRTFGPLQACLNLVLRSTVPIGFTRRTAELYGLENLVHSPEFLTARCSMVDAQIPSRNIIGHPQACGHDDKGELLVSPETLQGVACFKELRKLYQLRFPGVPIYELSSEESEAVKLFQNSFFATKVSFWNECRELADAHGLDWNAVMQAVLSDGRIHPSHTNVPGPDGRRGYGGACLRKDIANLICCMAEKGTLPGVSVIGASVTSNNRIRGEE